MGVGQIHIPEHLILRDTLYLLQGISGKYVQFSVTKDAEQNKELVFTEDPVSMPVKTLFCSLLDDLKRYHVPPPMRALIHRLAEVGHLYQRVDAFVREREGKVGVGMIEQSLCHHLQTQLTEYYRLIAVLESQMSTVTHEEDEAGEPERTREETGLTLKRLDVWIEDWRLRMRMMSVCVEGARGRAIPFLWRREDINLDAKMHLVVRSSTLYTVTRRMATLSFASSPTNFWRR